MDGSHQAREEMKPLTFFVRGRAATAGSKRGFALKRNGQYTGRVVMSPANPQEKDWKITVAFAAMEAMKKAELSKPFDGPMRLEVVFFLQRPKFHFNSTGHVKPAFSDLHTIKPDTTKLLRCLEDALRQIVWRDDSQVATTLVAKRYGPIPGAQVSISEESPGESVFGQSFVIPEQSMLSL